MALQTDNVVLRELTGVPELKDAEEFQRAVWGQDDPPDNSDIMLAIQHEGGLIAGAFLDGRMLGFLFGFPTHDPHVQHSHRLAVHPDSRGLGLGRKLKWYQRAWCLRNGITAVRWTYDPLRRINAGLNIATLGATARIYYPDYYGKMEGINAGVPSDRIVAEWQLNAPEVIQRTENPDRKIPQVMKDGGIQISIPRDFEALLLHDRKAATSERLRLREALTDAFASGYHISGFNLDSCDYLLQKLAT